MFGKLFAALIQNALPAIISSMKKTSPTEQPLVGEVIPEDLAAPVLDDQNGAISFEEYVTASGRYPERLDSPELTEEIKANIEAFLLLLNGLLADLDTSSVEVSSGFRPSEANKKIANAAKKSYHQIGKACDLLDDKNQTLYKLILSRPELLEKHGLWLEDGASTKGKVTNWAHIDCGERSARKIRVFKP